MAAHDNLFGSTSFLMASSDQENSLLSPNKLLLDYHAFLAETDTLLLSLETGNLHEQMSITTPPRLGPSSTQDQFMDDQKLSGAKVGQMSDERLQLRKALAAKRRLKYRQKLRQERRTLQQQKVDLSSELSSLLQKRTAARRNRAKNWGLAVWNAIAIREKEKRIVAEQKRRQLREAVILQASIFDQMSVQLQQQPIEGTVSRLCTDASHYM